MKTTKNEDDQKLRQPKTKANRNEDDQKQGRPKVKTTTWSLALTLALQACLVLTCVLQTIVYIIFLGSFQILSFQRRLSEKGTAFLRKKYISSLGLFGNMDSFFYVGNG